MNINKIILKITLSAMFLSIGITLPFLTGQIQTLGQMLSPMHLPVLLCGFICGPIYGLIVGFSLPLLRSLMFSMPPLYPAAIAMAFELGTYGIMCGILYPVFNKLIKNEIAQIYPPLVISMFSGRIVWGVIRFLLAIIDKTLMFNMNTFISGALLTVWPGIIIQLILVPIIIYSLKKANLLSKLK